MNNEAILNKLVEFGKLFVDSENCVRLGSMSGEIHHINWSDFKQTFNPIDAYHFGLMCDALVSECGRKNLRIKIEKRHLDIYSCTLSFEEQEEDIEWVYRNKYSRQAVIEAFCKVTNITGE